MNDIDWRDIKGLEEYNSMAEERAKRLMRKGISKRNTTDRKQSIQAT